MSKSIGPNDLQLLIACFPDKPWNWEAVIAGYCVTIDNVLAMDIKRDWQWSDLSLRIPYVDIKDNPHLPWDYFRVAENITVKFDDVRINKKLQIWGALSKNINITIENVLEYPDASWNWELLSKNPNMTPAVVRAYPKLPWNTLALCDNPSWTLSDYDLSLDIWDKLSHKACWNVVKDNLDKPWNWSYVSKSIDITPEFLECPYVYWESLSCNKGITIDIVLANINKPWHWELLSLYLPLTTAILRDNINLPWDWYWLSTNKSITIEIVREFSNISWYFVNLSRNIHIDDILTNLHLPWNWDVVSGRVPSWQIIRDNPHLSWNWDYISINQFAFEPHIYKMRLCRHYIQKWRHIIRRRKSRHLADFIHVLDHLNLYVRDKMAGTLRHHVKK